MTIGRVITAGACAIVLALAGCGGSGVPEDGPTETSTEAASPEEREAIDEAREDAIRRSNQGKPIAP